MMFKRKSTNPLNIVKMEKWGASDNDLPAFVAYTNDGNIYLTWDVRDIPIFCEDDVVKDMNQFHTFREVCQLVKDRCVEEINHCKYTILGMKNTFSYGGNNT